MNIKKATALLTLTFFLIAVLFGCAKGAEFDNKSNNIAIITKGSDSTFWNDMKNGALSAATEYNVNVTFEGPENEEDYNAQNKMIENAVSNNVGVIILSAIDFEKNADAVQKAINSGIKVITVDSDVDVNPSFADQLNEAEPFALGATGLLLTTKSAKLVELQTNKIDMPKACITVFLEFFTTQYSTQDAVHLRLLSLCLTFEPFR